MFTLDPIDFKHLRNNIIKAFQNFQDSANDYDSSSIEHVYQGVVKIKSNSTLISPILFSVGSIPIVLAKIIIEYSDYNFVMEYEIMDWQLTLKTNTSREFLAEKGLNIIFKNRNFYIKELHRIDMQMLNILNNKLNISTSIFCTPKGKKIWKK
jgi:hypothetical protein